MRRALFLLPVLLAPAAYAQSKPAPKYVPPIVDNDAYYANYFVGGGVSSDGNVHPASGQAGAEFGMRFFPYSAEGFGFSETFDLGVVGPLANRSTPTWLLGASVGPHILLHKKDHTVPFLHGGYHYLFGAGHSLSMGVGADYHLSDTRALRFEVHDDYTFANPNQHNVAFRIGWMFLAHNT